MMEVVTLEFRVVYIIITSLNVTWSCDNFGEEVHRIRFRKGSALKQKPRNSDLYCF